MHIPDTAKTMSSTVLTMLSYVVITATVTAVLKMINRTLGRALPTAWPQVSKLLRTDLTKSLALFWLSPVLCLMYAGAAYAYGRIEPAEILAGMAAFFTAIGVLAALIRGVDRFVRALAARFKNVGRAP